MEAKIGARRREIGEKAGIFWYNCRTMLPKSYNETDTRAKLITRALHTCGWPEDGDYIRRGIPVGAGAVEIGHDGITRRAKAKEVDYLLSVAFPGQSQLFSIAILEAKKESLPPDAGLQQAREYARLFHVPFVFSSNGHQFVGMNRITGDISRPQKISEFPGPDELQRQYEEALGLSLDDPRMKPLRVPYSERSGKPRYYQDAAIRAAMEKIARCEKDGKPPRILLPLATGVGKTFVAVNLLRRIAETDRPVCALFLCDRKELRRQAHAAFQKEFGSGAVMVENKGGENPAQNARIHIATYQTLDVGRDADSEDQNIATNGAAFNRFYPEEDYFTHIIIDECHRSAWDDWSLPLRRNPKAAHIGLTATPRKIDIPAQFRRNREVREEREITKDNHDYFGKPVYKYSIVQGMDDGYLALCLLDMCRPNLDMRGGLSSGEVAKHKPTDIHTGELVDKSDLNPHYSPENFERLLHLPDRVHAMCADLFRRLQEDDPDKGPDQKTIIFCETDRHADAVVTEMQNLRAELAKQRDEKKSPNDYAFKCTAKSNGANLIPHFRDSHSDRFIAVTVELLSTGVDVPSVRNIAFFRYLKSPIVFHQMLGRGTRIDEETGKCAFHVYDYTGVSALMGEELISRIRTKKKSKDTPPEYPTQEPVRKIRMDGVEVWINKLGYFAFANGEIISRAEYERRIAERIREKVRDQDDFRGRWVDPERREEMMQFLTDNGLSPNAALMADGRGDVDLYDYLAQVVWDAAPKTRRERVRNFDKNGEWLDSMDPSAAATIRAIIAVFGAGGTDELESDIFTAPRVEKAGGFKALENPGEIMTEIRRRLFAK